MNEKETNGKVVDCLIFIRTRSGMKTGIPYRPSLEEAILEHEANRQGVQRF